MSRIWCFHILLENIGSSRGNAGCGASPYFIISPCLKLYRKDISSGLCTSYALRTENSIWLVSCGGHQVCHGETGTQSDKMGKVPGVPAVLKLWQSLWLTGVAIPSVAAWILCWDCTGAKPYGGWSTRWLCPVRRHWSHDPALLDLLVLTMGLSWEGSDKGRENLVCLFLEAPCWWHSPSNAHSLWLPGVSQGLKAFCSLLALKYFKPQEFLTPKLVLLPPGYWGTQGNWVFSFSRRLIDPKIWKEGGHGGGS